MGNIVSFDAPDTYTSIVRTLQFFAQKYREDPAFASRVDESVIAHFKHQIPFIWHFRLIAG